MPTFNGATAFRRWKAGRHRRRLPTPRLPSMGPPPFGDGKRDAGDLPDCQGLPSMGPPPFGDGKQRCGCCRCQRPDALQWGHRLSAMERGQTTDAILAAIHLQWGHRLSAMESRHRLRAMHLSERPSMGPPPFGDGKPPPPAGNASIRAPFNGATAFRRWKAIVVSTSSPRRESLQWGHRLSAMESAASIPSPSADTPTFNGATAFRRWKGCRSICVTWNQPSSFNGATAFRRWKADNT